MKNATIELVFSNSIFSTFIVVLLGLMMGSFAAATVWRLRARQLVEDKAHGEDYDRQELKRLIPLTKRSLKDDRSQCLHCHHGLAWYDLMPLISWLSTGGKCRYCKKSIGWFEPLMEIGTGMLFAALYVHWSALYGIEMWPLLVAWLIVAVMMVILLGYDAKWFLLPDKVMFPLIALAAILSAWFIGTSSSVVDALITTAGAIVILSGLYFALWLVSKGAWIGFGDVKLGLALGLLLGDWMLAFLALFLANILGLVVALPGIMTKKMTRKAHIPFGPMLIVGFYIAFIWGKSIIDTYMHITTMLVL